ncbi:MAG: helix-turn-helix domain-containing protein [Cyanobacteriota bacterium]|nr:helix-turn-helix domain-containing protein [Cyanobacteriota bacterium]
MTDSYFGSKMPLTGSVPVADSYLRVERIKSELRMLGWSVVKVAEHLGVCKQTVSRVLHGKRSRRVEEGIAALLGKSVQEVWPERYPPPDKQIPLF